MHVHPVHHVRRLAAPRALPRPSAFFPALLAACAMSLTAAPSSRADDNGAAKVDDGFDLKVTKGEVTVTAHGEWHINQEFPWKLVVGDVKLDRSKFELAEKTAHVQGAPPGSAKLRGAICSKDVCRTLERDLVLP
jgi:hypothetical protein